HGQINSSDRLLSRVGLTYSHIGMYRSGHAARRDHIGPVQRHRRAAAAAHPRAHRRRGTICRRDRRRARDGAAVGLEAPPGAPGRRAGDRAAGRETDLVSHQRADPAHDSRLVWPVRRALARTAAPHQGTRGGKTMTTTVQATEPTLTISEEIDVRASIE